MYQNEVKGRSFKGENGERVDPYDALIYKYIGQGYKLNDHTANPKTNGYIRNLMQMNFHIKKRILITSLYKITIQ